MSQPTGYDDMIQQILADAGFKLSLRREPAGLSATPPAVRLLPGHGRWTVLDSTRPLWSCADRDEAIEVADALLPNGGVVYVVDEVGLITETHHVSPHPADPAPTSERAAAPVVGTRADRAPLASPTAPFRSANLSPLGALLTQVAAAEPDKRHETLDRLTEKAPELVHLWHAIHPLIEAFGGLVPAVQAFVRAVG